MPRAAAWLLPLLLLASGCASPPAGEAGPGEDLPVASRFGMLEYESSGGTVRLSFATRALLNGAGAAVLGTVGTFGGIPFGVAWDGCGAPQFQFDPENREVYYRLGDDRGFSDVWMTLGGMDRAAASLQPGEERTVERGPWALHLRASEEWVQAWWSRPGGPAAGAPDPAFLRLRADGVATEVRWGDATWRLVGEEARTPDAPCVPQQAPPLRGVDRDGPLAEPPLGFSLRAMVAHARASHVDIPAGAYLSSVLGVTLPASLAAPERRLWWLGFGVPGQADGTAVGCEVDGSGAFSCSCSGTYRHEPLVPPSEARPAQDGAWTPWADLFARLGGDLRDGFSYSVQYGLGGRRHYDDLLLCLGKPLADTSEGSAPGGSAVAMVLAHTPKGPSIAYESSSGQALYLLDVDVPGFFREAEAALG